jgi:hypothetical protein
MFLRATFERCWPSLRANLISSFSAGAEFKVYSFRHRRHTLCKDAGRIDRNIKSPWTAIFSKELTHSSCGLFWALFPGTHPIIPRICSAVAELLGLHFFQTSIPFSCLYFYSKLNT